jgi:hypothetical protein
MRAKQLGIGISTATDGVKRPDEAVASRVVPNYSPVHSTLGFL